jgi:hypothetical protein
LFVGTPDDVVHSEEFNPFQMTRARIAEYNSMNAILEGNAKDDVSASENLRDNLPVDSPKPPSS